LRGTEPQGLGLWSPQLYEFTPRGEHIVISASAPKEKWKFTVGLNKEGRCLLRKNGEKFEQWQVRKMALEGLIFNS
jgi:hypothetical protein